MVVPHGWTRRRVPALVIFVAIKYVSAGDARWARTSDSDRAALEVALRLAESTGESVRAVSVGPPGADAALREALAVGARQAVRVDAPVHLASAAVARAIAGVARGGRWLICGDASADRGSGAVPAFVAAELGNAQALGLVDVAAAGSTLRVTRRLDGGRRELLEVAAPAVLSVEGSVARLRRASLAAEVAARTEPVDVVPGPRGPVDDPLVTVPYRPRARTLAAPRGDALTRVRTLTDLAGAPAEHGHVLVLDPSEAATRILDTLAAWGYKPLTPVR